MPSPQEGPVDFSHLEIIQALQGTPTFVRELIAGGTAGGIAKSSVAPLERTKILFQTGRITQGHGVWRTLVDLTAKEGWRGLFRGNTATVTRIIPYSAIHFWAYEHFRRVFVQEARSRSLPKGPYLDLLAGSAAGASAVAITYPLDLVRTRMAWQMETTGTGSSSVHKSMPFTEAGRSSGIPASTSSGSRAHGQSLRGVATAASQSQPIASSRQMSSGTLPRAATMWSTATGVVSREGLAGLYKGMGPTLWGILPYAGIKFYVYQKLKERYRHLAVKPTEEGRSPRLPITLMLSFGAASGLVGQTLTYPLDIVRRRMQVQGAVSLPHTTGGELPGAALHRQPVVYRSTLDCLLGMAKREGIRSLFYGLHINYMKVVPSTALGFMIYDYMKSLLDLPNHL